MSLHFDIFIGVRFLVIRTGLSLKELLDRADAIKEAQCQADAEELKRAGEKMKSPSAIGDTAKAKAEQPLIKQKRKDAPPYKVSVYEITQRIVTCQLMVSRNSLPS